MTKSTEVLSPKSFAALEAHASNGQPSREAVAIRAYALYLERGSLDGHDLEDWLEAERQLHAEPEAEAEEPVLLAKAARA